MQDPINCGVGAATAPNDIVYLILRPGDFVRLGVVFHDGLCLLTDYHTKHWK